MDTETLIRRTGGPSALGRRLGISHSSVIGWRKTGQVPAGHVARLEEMTGIPRHEIRPDLYPPPSPRAEATPAAEPARAEPAYGSTEWVIARRNERPPIDINSVDVLNAMYEDDDEV